MLRGLKASNVNGVAEIAEKAEKEVTYHAERSGDLVVRLGDGSDESHRRMQAALDRLWPFAGEMFVADAIDQSMSVDGIAPDAADLKTVFDAEVAQVFTAATLTQPDHGFVHQGGKSGARHSEHLGHMLTQMQWLQRAYPGASW